MSNWILKAQLQARNAVENFVKGEEAPAGVEYGILIALISVVIIAGAALIGPEIKDAFDTVATKLTDANLGGS